LAKRHDTAVVCLRRRHDPPPEEELRRACVFYEEVEASAGPAASAFSLARLASEVSPLLGTPRAVRRADVASVHERLRRLAGEWRPDVVHVCQAVMGQYVRDFERPPAKCVLTVHEPGVTAARHAEAGARGLAAVRARIDRTAWVDYERRVLHDVDAVVVLTGRDRRTLAALDESVPIFEIPLGTAIPARPSSPLGVAPRSVLFVGNFRHTPNVEAAVRLARSIHPRVRRGRPDVSLHLVGDAPSRLVRALAGESITVTGAVDSVEPFLEAAAVVAAPLSSGGGMRMKVLEALAAGKAVVASPLAAEGLNVTDGDPLLLAGDDDAFASAIGRLLDDEASRGELARRARQWACARFGWERAIAGYETVHARLYPDRVQVRGAAPEWRLI
jgi:glycosyltransferase involved in cell wall biosynthesis